MPPKKRTSKRAKSAAAAPAKAKEEERKEKEVTRDEKMTYVCTHINDISTGQRKELAKMIVGEASMNESNIKEKGEGIQIKTDCIPVPLVNAMYSFIYNLLNKFAEETPQ